MTRPAMQSKLSVAANSGKPGSRVALGMAVAMLALGTAVTPALAETQAPTQATRSSDPQLQALIKQLNTQLQRGEKNRLIAPQFLKDLRATISQYDYPWNTLVFEDKFSGQDAKPAKPWQVVSGDFAVDWRYGMRSVVKPVPKQEAQQAQPAQQNALGQLFGALIKQATGSNQTDQPSTTQPATELVPAAAIAPVAISNAFAIHLELTSRPVDGVTDPRLVFGPYQGSDAKAGYRLALIPGQKPTLELTSVSARDTVLTLEVSNQPLLLQDGKAHSINWTRDSNGKMVISIDGKQVIDVTDRRFTDKFDGFSLLNQGGDFALQSIRIEGTGQ